MGLTIRDFGMCSLAPRVRYVVLRRGEWLVQRVDVAVVVPGKPLTSRGTGCDASRGVGASGDVVLPAIECNAFARHNRTRRLPDYDRPIGLLMVAVLPFAFRQRNPAGNVRRYAEAGGAGRQL